MLDVLDKYKDTFFVVELNFDPSKFEIRDPDPLIANDLMDGREPFLLYGIGLQINQSYTSLASLGTTTMNSARCVEPSTVR